MMVPLSANPLRCRCRMLQLNCWSSVPWILNKSTPTPSHHHLHASEWAANVSHKDTAVGAKNLKLEFIRPKYKFPPVLVQAILDFSLFQLWLFAAVQPSMPDWRGLFWADNVEMHLVLYGSSRLVLVRHSGWEYLTWGCVYQSSVFLVTVICGVIERENSTYSYSWIPITTNINKCIFFGGKINVGHYWVLMHLTCFIFIRLCLCV